jgi:hypothetical protein
LILYAPTAGRIKPVISNAALAAREARRLAGDKPDAYHPADAVTRSAASLRATLTANDVANRAEQETREISGFIRDKAEAMRAYARMANDTQLEMDAAELRLRAERRLGAMLTAEKDAGRLGKGVRKCTEGEHLTLDEVGIDRKLSARSQKVSGIGEKAFEAVVANVRQRIADQDGRVSLDVTAVDKKQRRNERETAPADGTKQVQRGLHGMADDFEPIRLNAAAPGGERVLNSFDDIGAFILIRVETSLCELPRWQAVRRDLPQARFGARQKETHAAMRAALSEEGWLAD